MVHWTDSNINWQSLNAREIKRLINTWGKEPAPKAKAVKKVKATEAIKKTVKARVEQPAKRVREGKQITLQVFEDPGHAWARFPKARLKKLGIDKKISPFSYQNGDNAFLEEDCDLSILVDALKAQGYDVKFRIGHVRRQSKIRNFAQYQA